MSGIDWVFEQGGWVSYALAGVSVLLWSAVTVRAIVLRPSLAPRDSRKRTGRTILDRFIREAQRLENTPGRVQQLAERTLPQYGTLHGFIKTMVAIAPLLGLLGTVIGMVDMFDSLQGTHTIDSESTVAGGISTAHVTTQLGLVIAAPGHCLAC